MSQLLNALPRTETKGFWYWGFKQRYSLKIEALSLGGLDAGIPVAFSDLEKNSLKIENF